MAIMVGTFSLRKKTLLSFTSLFVLGQTTGQQERHLLQTAPAPEQPGVHQFAVFFEQTTSAHYAGEQRVMVHSEVFRHTTQRPADTQLALPLARLAEAGLASAKGAWNGPTTTKTIQTFRDGKPLAENHGRLLCELNAFHREHNEGTDVAVQHFQFLTQRGPGETTSRMIDYPDFPKPSRSTVALLSEQIRKGCAAPIAGTGNQQQPANRSVGR